MNPRLDSVDDRRSSRLMVYSMTASTRTPSMSYVQLTDLTMSPYTTTMNSHPSAVTVYAPTSRVSEGDVTSYPE